MVGKVCRKNSPEVRPDFGTMVELGQPFGRPESGSEKLGGLYGGDLRKMDGECCISHGLMTWKRLRNSEYPNMIYDGPHMPKKLDVIVPGENEKMVENENKDYTPEDLTSILKDTKVRSP
ncbi:hypothetical protein AgCh_000765 [Apium graveolens]